MNYDETRCHLEEILANTRMVTLLQPVLDLEKSRVAGYEALSRGPSNSPLHAPQAMSRAAEHHGMLAALDWARIRLALGSFARLRLSGRLFLNLSAGSLLDAGFAPQTVLDALTAAGLDSSQVVFEITEDSAALDCTKLRQATSRLGAEGIEVAISVLGVGGASGRICAELKPSFVKIDRRFIADLHLNPHKIDFVRSIRQLAEGAHACVIAEGVETTPELAVLKDLGVPYAQGHLVARPSPVPIRLLPRDVEACLLSRRLVSSLRRREATPCTSRSADW